MDLKKITSGIARGVRKVPMGVYGLGLLVSGGLIGYNILIDESNPEYHFNGIIDGERVEFSEGWFDNDNELEVRLDNGDIVKRYDFDGDFLPDRIYITTGQGRIRLDLNSDNPDASVKVARDREQGKMKEYLDAILDIQTAPLNR